MIRFVPLALACGACLACGGNSWEYWCEGNVLKSEIRTCEGIGPQACHTARDGVYCGVDRTCVERNGTANCAVLPLQACDTAACSDDGRRVLLCSSGTFPNGRWPKDPGIGYVEQVIECLPGTACEVTSSSGFAGCESTVPWNPDILGTGGDAATPDVIEEVVPIFDAAGPDARF